MAAGRCCARSTGAAPCLVQLSCRRWRRRGALIARGGQSGRGARDGGRGCCARSPRRQLACVCGQRRSREPSRLWVQAGRRRRRAGMAGQPRWDAAPQRLAAWAGATQGGCSRQGCLRGARKGRPGPAPPPLATGARRAVAGSSARDSRLRGRPALPGAGCMRGRSCAPSCLDIRPPPGRTANAPSTLTRPPAPGPGRLPDPQPRPRHESPRPTRWRAPRPSCAPARPAAAP